MDTSEHDISTALAREASHGVPPQSIPGVDTDADYVSQA